MITEKRRTKKPFEKLWDGETTLKSLLFYSLSANVCSTEGRHYAVRDIL